MFGMGFQNIVKQQKTDLPHPYLMVRKHCRFPASCPIQQPNYLVQTFYHKTTRYLVKSSGEAPICSWKIPSSLAEALTQKMFQQDLFNTKSWFPNWIIKELMTLNDLFLSSNGSPDPTEE